MNCNTRLQRLGMWFAYRVLGDYGSPSLAALGLAPSFRWVCSGRTTHASVDAENYWWYK